MRLTHGKDKKDKVSTEAIGIKSAAPQAHLLREFFSQLASPAHYEKQLGVFVPTGAAHLLGVENYKKLICENNQFIHSVVTIPVGDFHHATMEIPFSLDPMTDIDMTTLQEMISDFEWCIGIEKTTIDTKVLITTMKPHLEQARLWIDHTLPGLYQQHIADKLDVTTLCRLTPQCLDRPVLTTASTAYADHLKTRTAALPAITTATKQFTKPPRTQKQSKVDMIFADNDFPCLHLKHPPPLQ